MVTHDPPTVSISCSNNLGRLKDTTNNIKSGNGFTVNIISEPFAEQANVCSINAPQDFSEWVISGLTKEPSVCSSIWMHLSPSLFIACCFTAPCKSCSCEGECF
jgi:flavin reductase (DIM6/NTAB) family NADH-FMN oxidoreductase RutF